MQGCVVCKTANCAREARSHTNFQTLWWLRYFIERTKKHHPKDVQRYCTPHKNEPTRHRTLSECGVTYRKLMEITVEKEVGE